MKQAFFLEWPVSGTADTFASIFDGRPTGTVTRTATEVPIAIAGTFRNLKVRLGSAPGTGKSRTFTLMVNGVASGLTVTISGAGVFADNTGVDVSVSIGDFVCLRHEQSGIPSDNNPTRISLEYENATTATSIYGCTSQDVPNNVVTAYTGALLTDGVYETASSGRILKESLIGPPGTLTGYRVDLLIAPGAGKSRIYGLVINGISQDGTGGTTDTRITIADAATSGSKAFSIHVNKGDRVAYEIIPSGTPTNSRHRFGSSYVADTTGYYILGTMTGERLLTSATQYGWLGGHNENWNTTEANFLQEVGTSGIIFVDIYVRLNDVPTSGDSYTFTLRRNSSSSLLTVTTTAQIGSATGQTDTVDGDFVSIQGVHAGGGDDLAPKVVFTAIDAAAIPEEEEEEPREPPSVNPAEACPCPPPDGGASPPGDTTPQGPGPIGGGGSGDSGTNPGGEGWTPGDLCTGGGTVNSYATATPGESMTDVTDERIWAEFAFVDYPAAGDPTTTPEYWAVDATMPDVPDAYGGRKDGRVFSVSAIHRAISDDNGNYAGQQVTLRLNDKDRATLRTRLGSETGKYVWEREGIIRIASEANRRSAYTLADPRELHRGVTRDLAPQAQFTASITLEDKLVSQFGAFGPDRSFPSRLLSEGMGCQVREIVGKPQQWIWGIVSDAGAIDPVTLESAEKGLVPLWLFAAVGSEDEYHLAAHECGDIQVYGSDGGTPPARVRLNEGDYRIEVLEIRDTNTDEVHRVTHVFLPSDSVASQAHKSGGVNLAANVCGVLGTNGETITNLFWIYQALFELMVLPPFESLTGDYLTAVTPTWADGRAMVMTESFADAQDFSVERIGGDGYQGGFVLGGPGNGPTTLREILRRMSNSGDCWFTWTAAGQLKVVLLDDTADIDATAIIREPRRLRALPTWRYAIDELENPVHYAYDWDDDKRRWRVAQATITNELAIARMGRPHPSPSPVEMRCVRDHMTARDVASRRLLRRQYPPAYFPVSEPLDGLDRDPGDMIRITSIEGPGTGCDERPMFIKETSYEPSARRVTHLCRDLTDIITGQWGEWASASVDTWDAASAAEQDELAWWADDDDTIPSAGAPGTEWR